MRTKVETRLFIDQPLAEGRALELGADQTHYLKSVLRLAPGAVIALFNGRDGEWRARIDGFSRGNCAIVIEMQSRAQEPDIDLWLLFAPIKRARIDFLVEKATELGVSAIYPVMTRYTMVERVNLARLNANMIEAAEQSERLTVPRLNPPLPLDRLLTEWNAARRLVLCDETRTAPPIAAALGLVGDGPVAVLVGPEGGFAEDELDALRKLPFVCPVSLGPRVLRADTAALAGIAIVQALQGEAIARGAAVR